MKLNEMTKEDLELLGYDDIAFLILENGKKPLKINEIFNLICLSLELDVNEHIDNIADLFEILTTDKRFIMLDNGLWDLKTRHSQKVVIDDEDNEIEHEIDESDERDDEEEEEPEESEDIFKEDEVEDNDDDLKDLVIINDDEESE